MGILTFIYIYGEINGHLYHGVSNRDLNGEINGILNGTMNAYRNAGCTAVWVCNETGPRLFAATPKDSTT